jgi:hypothetical protein
MRFVRRALRFGRRYYLAVTLLPFLLGFLAYWVIVAVDPYNLRGNRVVSRLANHRYPDEEWPRLLTPATAGSHELVLLGGSTTMRISTDMMRAAFPGARSPVNLSYIAPRPIDLAEVLARVGQVRDLRRVILVMDFTLMERRPLRSAAGSILANMSTTNWSHAGDFAPQTALASLNQIVYGTYDLPAWSHLDVPEFMRGATPVVLSNSVMQRIRRAIKRHANDVFAQSSLTCDQIPFIATVLVPFLADMASKHVAVDMVFPPLPYVLYYDWIENRPRFNILLGGPVFDQFMVFKKCVVAAREQSGAEDDRVIALDTNDLLSGDLRRYMDSAHLMNPEAYMEVMRMIVNGDEMITSTNIQSHEARLRSKILRAAGQIGAP